ncbi:MAG: hypothetical protein IJ794_13700 [Lachnospiraceae bacterium]|nr:hypothetical protein [Lachnospiraceae bacterium]
MLKILLCIAIVGHLLCGYCDCLITYVPGGKRFHFKAMSDNQAMAETFADMPLKNPVRSMVLGCLALFLCSLGYFGIYLWMKQFSDVYAGIILISSALFFIPGTAHHVFCGVAEWFYIRVGMSEDARLAVVQFFKSTSATMIACYIGLAAFAVTMFIAVVTGVTDLPKWMCVFNIIPVYIVLTPLRVGGTINWSAAVMFAGLLMML